MELVFAILLLCLGVGLIMGGMGLFIWAADHFLGGLTGEYLVLSVLVGFSGLTFILLAWWVARSRPGPGPGRIRRHRLA
ncbi:MAG: hypothetical protein C4525_15325 [Desulfarculus sp.]|jgi:hypothetical protein|nr:MAG: hypothetical protein C4525_15325 [Desulfarculus sp.]